MVHTTRLNFPPVGRQILPENERESYHGRPLSCRTDL